MFDLLNDLTEPLLIEISAVVASDPNLDAAIRDDITKARSSIEFNGRRYPNIAAIRSIVTNRCGTAGPVVHQKLIAAAGMCMDIVDKLNVLSCFELLEILDSEHLCAKQTKPFQNSDEMRHFVADVLKNPETETKIKCAGLPRKKKDRLAVLCERVAVQYAVYSGKDPSEGGISI